MAANVVPLAIEGDPVPVEGAVPAMRLELMCQLRHRPRVAGGDDKAVAHRRLLLHWEGATMHRKDG